MNQDYFARVVKIRELHPHPNADRLQIAVVFGMNVVVGLDTKIGDLCLYLPSGCQVDWEFAETNNLLRKPEGGGYLDEKKRNVCAIRLRGVKSDGILLPVSCLDKFGGNYGLKEGDCFDVWNGHAICRKYVPRSNSTRSNSRSGSNVKNSKHKVKAKIKVVFPQHIDSPQLKYNLDSFKSGDLITITEKLEGTSHRSALLPVKKTNFFKRLFGISEKIVYKDYCGSRRVVIKQDNSKSGYYGDNSFRLDIHKKLLPHLTPNLEVFGEIVGWPGEGRGPLMGEVDTKCLGDKNFTKTYGEKMIFHYGCKNGEYDFYIYRICELDEDGEVKIEYSTDQIISWCELHGFKYVPILYRGFLKEAEDILYLGETYCDGESTLAPHWREGCVIRRDNNARKFDVYKNKNFNYKVMKGIFVEQLSEEDVVDNDILEEM